MTLLHEKPLVFYTSQISYQGKEGEDGLDISGASNEARFLTPSWTLRADLLSARTNGLETEDTWKAYAAAYTAEMRDSYRKYPEVWKGLLARSRAVLCCFCDLAKHPGKCHRLLLADMLRRCGAVYLGELPASGVPHWLDLGAAEGFAQ